MGSGAAPQSPPHASVDSVNTIHLKPEIHEHIYVTKRLQRLRNNVYNFMHILNNIETNVTNNVNGTTHTDEMDRAALSTLRAVCRCVI